ncbi:MAG: nitroreductase family protein [Muribaculaceae bacterium]
MTLQEAITCRHSVRRYVSKPLSPECIAALQEKIEECNRLSDLHMQLVVGETRAFSGIMAYGKFSGVENYVVVASHKTPGSQERIGYYGEQIVLLAQTLGLNTCWAGISYRQVRGAYKLAEGEGVECMIALGYGETQGVPSKRKALEEISNCSDLTPQWFRRGVEAARLAPTAINQQKFRFEYLSHHTNGKPTVRATRQFSMVGYTEMDLGIAKLHFEIGAGKDNFEWEVK